jgi:hypothetical protein
MEVKGGSSGGGPGSMGEVESELQAVRAARSARVSARRRVEPWSSIMVVSSSQGTGRATRRRRFYS